MKRLALFVALGVAACTYDAQLGTGRSRDAAMRDGALDGSELDGSGLDGSDATNRAFSDVGPRPGEPPLGTVVCGGVTCASGEECCLTRMECTPAGDPSCAVPAEVLALDPRACARESDCDGPTWCAPTASGWPCLGLGRCRTVRSVATCIEAGTVDPVCGCDGRTYQGICAAESADVRSRAGVCGEPRESRRPCSASECDIGQTCDPSTETCVDDVPWIYCGIDSQCPSGTICCPYVGACTDAAACTVPPEGTLAPCATDMDCWRFAGASYADLYCDRPGCAATGGCRPLATDCDTATHTVCLCTGATTRACDAQQAGLSIAHEGACEM